MDHDITRYLNEHLAASSGALLLLQELADTHEGPGARGFFLDLQEAFEADQILMENLLERLGQKPLAFSKKTGSMNPRTRGSSLNGIEIEQIASAPFQGSTCVGTRHPGRCPGLA